MTSEQTKTILALMVQLASSDQNISVREDMFIKLYAHNHGVDSGEFDRICRSPELYTRSLSAISDKDRVFAHLCSFIHFDLKAEEVELEWCSDIGKRLDIEASKVDSVISEIRNSAVPLKIEEILDLVK